MEIVKAVQRLGWRFSEATKKKNTFTVNDNDLQALKSIASYVEQTQKQQFQKNQLFAKLYIKVYCKMIEHYKTDILDPIPRKRMNEILSTPMEHIIEEFTERMNDNEKMLVLEGAGIDLKHPLLRNEKKTVEHTEKIKELLRSLNNDYSFLEDTFKIDFVTEGLKREVNHALNIN